MDDIIVNVHTNKSRRSFVKLFFNVKHHLLLRSRGAECPLMVPLKGLKDRKSRRLPTVLCCVRRPVGRRRSLLLESWFSTKKNTIPKKYISVKKNCSNIIIKNNMVKTQISSFSNPSQILFGSKCGSIITSAKVVVFR